MESKLDKFSINFDEIKEYKEAVNAFENQFRMIKPSTPEVYSNVICKFLTEKIESGLKIRENILND